MNPTEATSKEARRALEAECAKIGVNLAPFTVMSITRGFPMVHERLAILQGEQIILDCTAAEFIERPAQYAAYLKTLLQIHTAKEAGIL